MARHYAPSLSHSEGEGRGGVLLAGNAPCRARLGTTLPPFRIAKGRAGEGCFWLAMPPAEHGSALPAQRYTTWRSRKKLTAARPPSTSGLASHAWPRPRDPATQL